MAVEEPSDPDAPVGPSERRRRQRFATGVLVAALGTVVVVAVAVVALGDDSEGTDPAGIASAGIGRADAAGDQPEPDAPEAPAQTPSSADPPPDSGLATTQEALTAQASDAGVVIVGGDGDARDVVDTAAARAFVVADGLVTFQAAGGDSAFPPLPEGPVMVVEAGSRSGESRPLGTSGDRARLMDARYVDGRPVALVAEDLGSGEPEATGRFVLVDLVSGERRETGTFPTFEAGYASAVLTPDGGVVGVRSMEARVFLDRWDVGATESSWEISVGTDVNASVALLDGEVLVTASSFAGEGFDPVLDVLAVDPGTGLVDDQYRLELEETDTSVESGLFCGDTYDADRLLCSSGSAPPVAVHPGDGTVEALPGAPGAVASSRRQP